MVKKKHTQTDDIKEDLKPLLYRYAEMLKKGLIEEGIIAGKVENSSSDTGITKNNSEPSVAEEIEG